MRPAFSRWSLIRPVIAERLLRGSRPASEGWLVVETSTLHKLLSLAARTAYTNGTALRADITAPRILVDSKRELRGGAQKLVEDRTRGPSQSDPTGQGTHAL